MATLHVQATREDVTRMMTEFVRALTGQGGAYQELVRGIQLRLSMVMLSQIQQDFITKSQGGTGVDGITWKPLSEKYLAYGRRFGPGEKGALLKAAGARSKGGRRPLLTAAEDKQWRLDFARAKAMLMARGLEGSEVSGRAAAIAWTKAKAAGGKTKLGVFGHRQVDILRDTGLLLRSFSPGIASAGQVLRFPPGRVVVGTNRMTWHHTGTRRGLPARPFWPVGGNFPSAYWQPILKAAQQGILEAVTLIMASRARAA